MIFCEGTQTEPEYINALKLTPAVREVASVDLRIESNRGRSDPRSLVSMAVGARRKAADEEAEIDEFWCVFDVEWPANHPGLMEAVDEASRGGVEVAVSNPSFELWLILHLRDCNAWLTSDEAYRLRGELDGSTGKGLDPSRYLPHVERAMHRAALLDRRHEGNESRFPHNNPSSGMHRLLSAIPVTAR